MDAGAEKRYPSPHFRHSPRAAVAQWIEYWPPKPRVVGSIPASRASTSETHAALQAQHVLRTEVHLGVPRRPHEPARPVVAHREARTPHAFAIHQSAFDQQV